MPQYKVTFIFNQNRQGWSETWYYNTSTLKAVQDATNALAKLRAKMLGMGSTLEAARITDVAKPRQCGLLIFDTLPGDERGTDTPHNAILAEICAGDAEYRRSFMLRGVPDVWIVWDNILHRMIHTNEATKAFDKFVVGLKTGWQLRVISKDDADVNVKDTGGLLINADGNVEVTIAGTTAVAGQTIRFDGWVGPDSKILNRVFKVLKVVGPVVTLDLRGDVLTNLPENNGGKAHHHKIVYRAITEGMLLRPAKKSTGRAFFVPLGRRRA